MVNAGETRMEDGMSVTLWRTSEKGARRKLEEARKRVADLGAKAEEVTRDHTAARVQITGASAADLDKLSDRLAKLASRSDVGATADFAAQVLLLDLRSKLASIRVPVVAVSPFHAPDLAAMGIDEAGKTQYYRFLLQGVEGIQKEAILKGVCPNILFPYAREAVTDVVSRGTFPQFLLQPINFEAAFAENLRQQQLKAKAAEEAAKH